MSKNADLLASFIAYCEAHPDERFWQALRNWSGHAYILTADNKDDVRGQYRDTFYWRTQSE